jgi:hypothetical protein
MSILKTLAEVREKHPAPALEIPERDTSDLIDWPTIIKADTSDLIEAPKVDWLNVALGWTTLGFIGYLLWRHLVV